MLAGDAPPGATEGVKLSGALKRVFTFSKRDSRRTELWRSCAPVVGSTVPKVKAQGVNLSGKRTKFDFISTGPARCGGFFRYDLIRPFLSEPLTNTQLEMLKSI